MIPCPVTVPISSWEWYGKNFTCLSCFKEPYSVKYNHKLGRFVKGCTKVRYYFFQFSFSLYFSLYLTILPFLSLLSSVSLSIPTSSFSFLFPLHYPLQLHWDLHTLVCWGEKQDRKIDSGAPLPASDRTHSCSFPNTFGGKNKFALV